LDDKIGVSLLQEEDLEDVVDNVEVSQQQQQQPRSTVSAQDDNDNNSNDDENSTMMKRTPKILINTIAPDSLFAFTRLSPGMQVLKINNVSFVNNNNNNGTNNNFDVGYAMRLLRESEDVITLEVCKNVVESETRQDDSFPSSTTTTTTTNSPSHADNLQPETESNRRTTSFMMAEDVRLVRNDHDNNNNNNNSHPDGRSRTIGHHNRSSGSAPPVAVASTVAESPSGTDEEEIMMIVPMASAEPLLDHSDNYAATTSDKPDNLVNINNAGSSSSGGGGSSSSSRPSQDTIDATTTAATASFVDASDTCVAYPTGENNVLMARIPKIIRNTLDTNGVVTVTATKPSPHAAIGIAIKHKIVPPQIQKRNQRQQQHVCGGVLISNIKDFSIFHGTHLQRDMTILSINGHDCSHIESPERVAQLLKQECRHHGCITLVAQFVSPYIINDVVVLEENKIMRKNNTVQNDTTTATTTIHGAKEAPESITSHQALRTRTSKLVTVTAAKTKLTAKVGVKLRNIKGVGTIVITGLNPSSIFAGSSIQAGMQLYSINGLEVTGTSTEYCRMLLSNIESDVTLVAREVVVEDDLDNNDKKTDTSLNQKKKTATQGVPSHNNHNNNSNAVTDDRIPAPAPQNETTEGCPRTTSETKNNASNTTNCSQTTFASVVSDNDSSAEEEPGEHDVSDDDTTPSKEKRNSKHDIFNNNTTDMMKSKDGRKVRAHQKL